MSVSAESESEILLGNKQLLAVFGVVALLLAVAFTGGYMLGKNAAQKKVLTADHTSEGTKDTGNVTKVVAPEDAGSSGTEAGPAPSAAKSETPAAAAPKPKHETGAEAGPILGAPGALPEGVPKPGQTFIQVTALTHRDAEGTAEVLRKQNFRARLAPKPGSTTVYRVLVGPIKDAADLASTRDALRKIGFRDVFPQHY